MFVRSSCLTDMCLNVIVHNLEVIVTNEKIPAKSVDFLHRLYAGRVFYEYRKINKAIKEDVMLWFLSPHVKEITLPRKLFSEKIVDKLQSIGMGITSLNLHRSSAPENVLQAIIRCVPCVKIFDLSHTKCTDDTLTVIQETCADLESLNLSYCDDITDDGLENLCGTIQSLKILDVRGCFGVKWFGPDLNKMPLLECVRYDDFTDILLERTSAHRKYNITELMYDGCHRDDSKAIRKLTKMCPKIKKLHFEFPVKKKALKEFAGFQQLEELKFKVSHRFPYNVRMSNFLAPILPISLNLKTLILSCLQIPTVMLIENFKNLEKLYLKKVSFTSFKKEDIKCTENKLDVLVIKRTDMEVSTTYQAIAFLISLSKNVTKLDLSYNRKLPSDLFDVILNSMKNLSCVSFKNTPVKIAFLIPFFDIHSLKKIITDYSTNYSRVFMNNFVQLKLLPKSSSTLSWRHVYDKDSNESDSTDDDSMDDCVISNYCDSGNSASDGDSDVPSEFDNSELAAMGYESLGDSDESDAMKYEESN